MYYVRLYVTCPCRTVCILVPYTLCIKLYEIVEFLTHKTACLQSSFQLVWKLLQQLAVARLLVCGFLIPFLLFPSPPILFLSLFPYPPLPALFSSPSFPLPSPPPYPAKVSGERCAELPSEAPAEIAFWGYFEARKRFWLQCF